MNFKEVHSNRLEKDNVSYVYGDSRREQVRPQEFVMKEKAFRETLFRSMHEVVELKTAQEMRIDKSSRMN